MNLSALLGSYSGMAIVACVAVGLLVAAYLWGKRGASRSEGFQTAAGATPTIPNIPEEAMKAMEPCTVMKNMIQNLDNQIAAAEAGTTAPGQLELLKLTRGSMQQQLEALKCT